MVINYFWDFIQNPELCESLINSNNSSWSDQAQIDILFYSLHVQ